MRVLSLGGGVQSTTLFWMALDGAIQPVDHVIFADTGAEVAATYVHLGTLQHAAEKANVPFWRVSGGRILEEWGSRIPPVFVDTGTGGRLGMVPRRQCTSRYKVEPIHREIKRLMGITRRRKLPNGVPPATILKGISLDEIARAKPIREWWARSEFPLLDLRMRRADCERWLAEHGYDTPPKSACVICPYRSDANWRQVRDTDPAGWAAAQRYDAAIRDTPRLAGRVYLHHSGVALAEAPIDAPETGQIDLFQEDCDGYCGV